MCLARAMQDFMTEPSLFLSTDSCSQLSHCLSSSSPSSTAQVVGKSGVLICSCEGRCSNLVVSALLQGEQLGGGQLSSW